MNERLREEKAIESGAQMAKNLPASTQFALVKCLKNIPYGAHWGLCTTEEVRDNIESIKQDKNLATLPVNGGVVLQVARGYLEKACNTALKGMLTREDIQTMNKMNQEAEIAFVDFLKKTAKKNSHYSAYIGIFCTNQVSNIRYNNVDYPAFRITLQRCLEIMKIVNVEQGTNYRIVLSGKEYTVDSVLGALRGNPKLVSKGLLMSPTNTGVFMRIEL